MQASCDALPRIQRDRHGFRTGVDIALGTRVTIDPNIACGACDYCLQGRPNLCRNNVAIGLGRDGGFAPLAVVPAHRAIPLPRPSILCTGALAEPLACTLHGIDIGDPRPGERAIVVGGGVIGLMALSFASLPGPRRFF